MRILLFGVYELGFHTNLWCGCRFVTARDTASSLQRTFYIHLGKVRHDQAWANLVVY
jgi:hypothetical protein